MWRIAGAAAVLAGMAVASPASAQFFFQSHDFGDGLAKGDEPGMTVPMPGATAAEQKAALAWTGASAAKSGFACSRRTSFKPTFPTDSSISSAMSVSPAASPPTSSPALRLTLRLRTVSCSHVQVRIAA